MTMFRPIYSDVPKFHPKEAIISGSVIDNDGPVSREVVLVKRHDQEIVQRTWSDPTTGNYLFTLRETENNLYRVMVLAGNPTENTQVYDYIRPVVIS